MEDQSANSSRGFLILSIAGLLTKVISVFLYTTASKNNWVRWIWNISELL